MLEPNHGMPVHHLPPRHLFRLCLFLFLAIIISAGPAQGMAAGNLLKSNPPPLATPGADQADPLVDEQIEHAWHPAYLSLATGDPNLSSHGVYDWPFDLNSIGWSMQSYQNYGGDPYFHHGMDMMKIYGTEVYNRSGGQVINIENYQPGNDLYWEVAVLDPDGYIWQYHHIEEPTIPQEIWDKYYEYLADPINGGFIPPDTHLGNIIYWPVWSFGKQFNHIHLNILAEGGVYVNGFEFHEPLPDTVGPEIQNMGLLQNGQIIPGDSVEGDYSLYVHARDLILDDVYYLPPWKIDYSVDCGPEQTTWQFDTLPGGADDHAYLDDFYVVPPTCGDYECRDYYIDLGFIPDSQFSFPADGGLHYVQVSVSDYAGSQTNGIFSYNVLAPPLGSYVWQDDLETDQGWVTNPDGTDTATSGQWERSNPEPTNSNGPKQLGITPSGVNDLVTGALAGANATSFDIDGGVTSVRSPAITLPVDVNLTLSFRYYLAHGSNSSSADYLRVSAEGNTTLTVFEETGAADNDNGMWVIKNVSLNAFAGQTIHLLIEAADASDESLVEAAIDDVLIVSNPNGPPTAVPQTVAVLEDTLKNILLSGCDPDGDPLTYNLVANPSHGTLDGTLPDLTYTPELNYYGSDSFSFTVSDGAFTSEPAMVEIEVTPVNDAPVANPQTASTLEDIPVDILLTGSDVDGDPLAYDIVSPPIHGILSGNAPELTYTPDANFDQVDSFTFVVNDGTDNSGPAVVDIEVSPVNDPPVADEQSVTTQLQVPISITLTGSDIDSASLTYSVSIPPSHGTLSGVAPNLTYTPTSFYTGPDSIVFTINDGELDSAPAVVSIMVNYGIFTPLLFK